MDDQMREQIGRALEVGYHLYEERGWI
jgi:hypothetical protein